MPDIEKLADRKTTVFVSYSRKDKAHVQLIIAGLEDAGITVTVDADSIGPGEEWRPRIEDLIQAADAMVFAISPASIVSRECLKELKEALAKNKRIIPVVIRQTDNDAVPKPLSALNYIFMMSSEEIVGNLPDLTAAIFVRIDWVRNHTRYGVDAARWSANDRKDHLLLRDEAIEAAEEWLAEAPAETTLPTLLHREFISRSRLAFTKEQKRRIRRARQVATGAVVATVIIAIVAAIAWWQRGVAEEQREQALLQADENTLQLADFAENQGVVSLADGDPTAAYAWFGEAMLQIANHRDETVRRSVIEENRHRLGLADVLVPHRDKTLIASGAVEQAVLAREAPILAAVTKDRLDNDYVEVFDLDAGHQRGPRIPLGFATFSLPGQPKPIAISDDGTRLMVLSQEAWISDLNQSVLNVSVYDTETARRVAGPLALTERPVGAFFDPAVNGFHIVTGTHLDAQTFIGAIQGLPVLVEPEIHVRTVNATLNEKLPPVTLSGLVLNASFSPRSGQLLITGGPVDAPRIVDARAQREVTPEYPQRPDVLNAFSAATFALSPSGRYLASNNDAGVKLFDIETGQPLLHAGPGSASAMVSFYDPDDTTYASLFSVAKYSNPVNARLVVPNSAGSVVALTRFDEQGDRTAGIIEPLIPQSIVIPSEVTAVSTGNKGEIIVGMASGRALPLSWVYRAPMASSSIHANEVTFVENLPADGDHKRYVSASRDGTIKIWSYQGTLNTTGENGRRLIGIGPDFATKLWGAAQDSDIAFTIEREDASTAEWMTDTASLDRTADDIPIVQGLDALISPGNDAIALYARHAPDLQYPKYWLRLLRAASGYVQPTEERIDGDISYRIELRSLSTGDRIGGPLIGAGRVAGLFDLGSLGIFAVLSHEHETWIYRWQAGTSDWTEVYHEDGFGVAGIHKAAHAPRLALLTTRSSFTILDLSHGPIKKFDGPTAIQSSGITLSPNGKTALVAMNDATLALFHDADDFRLPKLLEKVHSKPIARTLFLEPQAVSCPRDRNKNRTDCRFGPPTSGYPGFASASIDGSVVLWSESGEILRVIAGRDNTFRDASDMALATDGTFLFYGDRLVGQIGVIDIERQRLVGPLPVPEINFPYDDLKVSDDGNALFIRRTSQASRIFPIGDRISPIDTLMADIQSPGTEGTADEGTSDIDFLPGFDGIRDLLGLARPHVDQEAGPPPFQLAVAARTGFRVNDVEGLVPISYGRSEQLRSVLEPGGRAAQQAPFILFQAREALSDGDYQEALAKAGSALEIARGIERIDVLRFMASILSEQNDWPGTSAISEEILNILGNATPFQDRLTYITGLQTTDPSAATAGLDAFEEDLNNAPPGERNIWLVGIGFVRAGLLAQSGNMAAAVSHYDAWLNDANPINRQAGALRIDIMSDFSLAHYATGNREAAVRAATEAVDIALVDQTPKSVVSAARAALITPMTLDEDQYSFLMEILETPIVPSPIPSLLDTLEALALVRRAQAAGTVTSGDIARIDDALERAKGTIEDTSPSLMLTELVALTSLLRDQLHKDHGDLSSDAINLLDMAEQRAGTIPMAWQQRLLIRALIQEIRQTG